MICMQPSTPFGFCRKTGIIAQNNWPPEAWLRRKRARAVTDSMSADKAPGAVPFLLPSRRNRPEIDGAAVDHPLLLGLPVAHVEGVAYDPRARLQLRQQLRAQLFVEARQQIERDHARLRNVGLEQIALAEADEVRDAGGLRIGARLGDALRID